MFLSNLFGLLAENGVSNPEIIKVETLEIQFEAAIDLLGAWHC